MRQGLGTLSCTRRGRLLSKIGTLSNWRGEAREVTAKQEIRRNIFADVRLQLCDIERERRLNTMCFQVDDPWTSLRRPNPWIGVINRDSSIVVSRYAGNCCEKIFSKK